MLIEVVVLEGPLEGTARTGLVAGAKQMPAEIGVGPRVPIVDRQAAAYECRRFVEAVVARGVVAGDAIHLAVDRVDLQDLLDPGVSNAVVLPSRKSIAASSECASRLLGFTFSAR